MSGNEESTAKGFVLRNKPIVEFAFGPATLPPLAAVLDHSEVPPSNKFEIRPNPGSIAR